MGYVVYTLVIALVAVALVYLGSRQGPPPSGH
jgi:hypothetical protein